MTGISDIVKEYWGALVALVGLIGWLFRVESRGLSNEREIRRLERQWKEDVDETKDSLKEIQRDIKKLLERRP